MKKTLAYLFLTGIFLTACGGTTPSSPIDDRIYKDALNSNNIKLCDTIEGTTLKNECKQTIQEMAIQSDAIAKSDLNLCKTIKNKQLKDSCTIQIQAAIDKKNKFKNLIDDRQKITLEAIDKHDPKICKKINDSNFQQECILNVTADSSYTDKDKSVCDMLTNEDLKQSCLNNPKFN
ncbi:hypothetical protein HZA40_05045 [Candidatus Peregrinibacteria bacterium]|nr:hypothetical protein [Candidatus Peregrinibacteria bacterium]